MPTDDAVTLLAAATFITPDADREAAIRFAASIELDQLAGQVAAASL